MPTAPYSDVVVIGVHIDSTNVSLLTPFLDENYGRTARYCVSSSSREIPLLPAYFGVDAGVAGCAACCSGEAALTGDGLIFSSGTTPVPSRTP